MLSSLNTNSLTRTQNLLQLYAQQISSGQSINSAAANPAGLAIADAQTSQLNGQNTALTNISAGLSVTDIAGGALGQISSNLQQMRALAVQAANPTLNSSDLPTLQTQMTDLSHSIDGIAGNSQYNNQLLLNGSYAGQLQTGPNPGDTQNLSLDNASSSALGVSGLNVSSPANATSALNSIDNALKSVNTQQSNLAGVAAGLSTNFTNLTGSYTQLAQAQSQVQGTDYTQATSHLSQARLQNQVGVYALKMYQDIQKTSTLGVIA
jgi:flagellin